MIDVYRLEILPWPEFSNCNQENRRIQSCTQGKKPGRRMRC
jgi:hypothetical protein